MSTQKRQFHANMGELKEPLISDPIKDALSENYLKSFLRSKYPSRFNSGQDNNDEENIQEHHSNDDYKPPLKDAGKIADQAAKSMLIDFYKENSDIYEDVASEEEEDVEEEEEEVEGSQADKKSEKSEDPEIQMKKKRSDRYAFFKQATAQHPIPKVKIMHFQYNKADPTQFVTVTRASQFFTETSLKLKEQICLADYKRLEKIRLRNYIFVMRMLTQVDSSDVMYKQVKRRLLQIRRVCEYVDLCNKEDNDYDDGNTTKHEIKKLYERLAENKPISDLEEDSENEEEDKKSKQNDDFEDYKQESENEDEEENQDGEDQEYNDYFGDSMMNGGNNENYLLALLNEEKKWVIRAAWLEDTIEGFRADIKFSTWVSWFEAKLEQLQELDLPIKDNSTQIKSTENSHVFYLHSFLHEYFEEQEKKKSSSDPSNYLKDEYAKDLQVYIDEQNFYPKVQFNVKDAKNTNDAIVESDHNIRDKLCLRIQKREAATEYFLTVFQRRNLGNEKIYEKRLNFRGRTIEILKIQFQGKGQFLHLSFFHNDDCYYGGVEENYQEDSEAEENEKYNIEEAKQKLRQNQIDLIFPLEAQFKSPLLIKPNSQSLGFFGDKHFYSYQLVDVVVNKPVTKKDGDAKEAAEQQEEEEPTAQDEEKIKDHNQEDDQSEQSELPTKQVLRVYEYDLHNFQKIKAQDLGNEFVNVDYKTIAKKHFGRAKDGFYMIYTKNIESKDTKDKSYTHIIVKGKDEYKIQLNDKRFKFQIVGDSKRKAKETLVMNEKGDKIMVIYKTDEGMAYARLAMDPKTKLFKQDNTEFKSIKESFPAEENGAKYNFEIIPALNDFIILAKKKNKTESEVFIYFNEQFVTKYVTNFGDLSFNVSDNHLQAIYNVKATKYNYVAKHSNFFQYNVCERQGEKMEWSTKSHDIYNMQKIVHFPYVFFFYNHDQLYMKDLTCYDKEGYYYMNNFLGIDQRFRPLTVQAFNYWNVMCINVPVVESKYNSNQFTVLVHQITTLSSMANPYKLTNTFLHQKVFGFNEQLMSQINIWAKIITNNEGQLDNDIRFIFEGGYLKIEKWDRNKCIQRVIITHYQENHCVEDRDVTNIEKNEDDQNPMKTLDYICQTYKLIIFQRPDGISAFIKDLDQTTGTFDFSDPSSVADRVWEVADDDQSNPIVDVMVDTLAYQKVSIYLIYQDSKMKKFTATVPLQGYGGEGLEFEEYTRLYKMDQIYAEKTSSAQKTAAQSSKKQKIFTNFIANEVFYSTCVTIDYATSADATIVINAIDLKADQIQNKMQIGYSIDSPFTSDVTYLGYSWNEGRLACLQTDSSDEIILTDTLIITPLFNTRSLPQFNHGRFRNTVVPLVDQENGFTSVFTLNIQNTLNAYQYNNDGYAYYFDATHLANQDNSKKVRWTDNYNVTPGLLIKYFNGVERTITIEERYMKIDRFVISKDGHHFVIVGLKFELARNNEVYVKDGMFLYEIQKDLITVTLKQSIPFAARERPANFGKQESIAAVEEEIKNAEEGEEDQSVESEHQSVTIHNFMDAEIDEYTFKEFPDDYDYDSMKYYGALTDDGYEKDIVVEQSEDEDEELEPVLRKQKSLFSASTVAEDEEKQKKAALAAKAEKKGVKIPNILPLFPKFDIPQLHEREDISSLLKEYDDAGFTKVDSQVCLHFDSKTYSENYFNEQETEKIKKIHANLHLQVNENGHIFLINRLSNKLYFFYQSTDDSQEFKLEKITLSPKLNLLGADSSGSHVLVWGKKELKLFDISSLISQKYQSYALQTLTQENAVSSKKPKELTIQNIGAQIKTIKSNIVNDARNELMEVEEYEYTIIEAFVINGKIILKIEDADSNHLKIFNVEKQILLNYIEFDQVALSGDKKFIWLPIKEKVYDIENNLTTLFFWPDNKTNTLSYDSMGVFNVNNNRTILATQGILHFSFSFINAQNDIESLDDFLDSDMEFSQRLWYMFYKLPNDNSIVSKIFSTVIDVAEFSKTSKKTAQDIELETQTEHQQLLQRLMNVINSLFDSDKMESSSISEFFLSFFTEEQQQQSPHSKVQPISETKVYKNIFQSMFKHQQPRFDIIEDILSYVVQSIELPITQAIINASFIDFLKTADTSQAFREYLENGILKTAKMEKVEKYPIIATDQGYKLDSYISPIMDEGFNRKFTDDKESKKDVIIQYIFVGDLLETSGEEIMSVLQDDRFLDLMSIPFMKYLVLFQWNSVQTTIKTKTLYPFYALLGLFTAYTMLYVSYVDDVEGQYTEPLGHLTTGEKVQYELMILMLSVVIGYFFYLEARQCIQDVKDYFSSFWNLTDLISYSLCFMVVFLDVFNQPKTLLRPIASIAVIILWIKLFYFLRVYESTSQLIRMIIEITQDMKYFLFVLLIGIVGFTGGLYILQYGLNGKLTEEEMGNEHFVGNNPFKAFIYTYRMTLGDFQLDAFSLFEDKGLVFEFYFVWFIFIVGSLFLVIVLLNLLIAIMGDTFGRVQEQIANMSTREKVLLVSENESFFNRKELFRNSQYLIIISQKKTEGSQEDSFETHINSLKTQLMDKVSNLETELKSQISETQQELKRKFQEQEEKSKKSTLASDQKYEDQIKSTLNSTVTKINEMFTIQQLQIARIQNQVMPVGDQVKVMKIVQEQMEKMKNDQGKLTKNLYKKLGIDGESDHE